MLQYSVSIIRSLIANFTYTFSMSRKIEPEEWPWEVMYPSYCNGWLYIVTPKIVKLLLKAVATSPFLFIDDVYITGILR